MVVITLSDCPPKVRGDLSKWLFEVNTGVYVGNLSARVRDELWVRVCDNLKRGRATMVYSAPGEQKLNFEVYNSYWEPVDLDGIKLMRRPSVSMKDNEATTNKSTTSRAGKMLAAKRAEAARKRECDEYVVIDIETTGLSPEKDRIIEIAALLVDGGETAGEYATLVNPDVTLERKIVELTGITNEMLRNEGIPIKNALEELVKFVGNRPIVCHNANFDYSFLMTEAKRNQVRLFRSQCKDTLVLARRRVSGVQSYTLNDLGEYFGFEAKEVHRALPDCRLTYQLFEKLNEL